MTKRTIAIVTPILNDWESFGFLIRDIAALEALAGDRVILVAVDDGSTAVDPPHQDALTGCLEAIHVISLKANQGHQRAIALGLAYVERNVSADIVIVMDSDGEDTPDSLADLVEAHESHPEKMIVAQRAQRSESVSFRLFYQIYKFVFFLLTGKAISFGNFCLAPKARLSNLLYNAGVWNNIAATMLKSRVPIHFVPTNRGTRYSGESKMNFTSLMIHGFSAISVFTDVVIGRIITFLVGASTFVIGCVIGVVGLKLFTSVFVPGYATYVILFLVTMLAITLFTGFLMILSLLATREQAASLPSRLIDDLVDEVGIVSRSSVINSVAS
ncbi:MAG: glycosyltransferase [Pseudomonadota bacterium]